MSSELILLVVIAASLAAGYRVYQYLFDYRFWRRKLKCKIASIEKMMSALASVPDFTEQMQLYMDYIVTSLDQLDQEVYDTYTRFKNSDCYLYYTYKRMNEAACKFQIRVKAKYCHVFHLKPSTDDVSKKQNMSELIILVEEFNGFMNRLVYLAYEEYENCWETDQDLFIYYLFKLVKETTRFTNFTPSDYENLITGSFYSYSLIREYPFLVEVMKNNGGVDKVKLAYNELKGLPDNAPLATVEEIAYPFIGKFMVALTNAYSDLVLVPSNMTEAFFIP